MVDSSVGGYTYRKASRPSEASIRVSARTGPETLIACEEQVFRVDQSTLVGAVAVYVGIRCNRAINLGVVSLKKHNGNQHISINWNKD